jgi:hypothetical protein
VEAVLVDLGVAGAEGLAREEGLAVRRDLR